MKKIVIAILIAFVLACVCSCYNFGQETAGPVQDTSFPQAGMTETSDPDIAIPKTTVSETSTLQSTEQETTLPATTISHTTVPPTTVSPTTVPPTTAPPTTVPPTTVPPTTVPPTMAPPTTTPPTTVPPTTVPPTTTPNESPHTHSFGPYQVNSFHMPSETKTGEIYRFCECGYRDSRRIPSLDYNVTDPITGEHICALYTTSVAATCIRPRYSVIHCTGCDYEVERDSGSTTLANHDYSDWIVTIAATATERGEQTRTCQVCGKVNTEIIPATEEHRESYIDPALEVKQLPSGVVSYRGSGVSVVDTRTWGDPPSIRILEDESLDIKYYKQDGTIVSYILKPQGEEYWYRFVILEDGSFATQLNGDYSD